MPLRQPQIPQDKARITPKTMRPFGIDSRQHKPGLTNPNPTSPNFLY